MEQPAGQSDAGLGTTSDRRDPVRRRRRRWAPFGAGILVTLAILVGAGVFVPGVLAAALAFLLARLWRPLPT